MWEKCCQNWRLLVKHYLPPPFAELQTLSFLIIDHFGPKYDIFLAPSTLVQKYFWTQARKYFWTQTQKYFWSKRQKYINMFFFSLSPQIFLQFVAALKAIGPLVAQSRKSEDLQKLLRLVQLAGEVSLKKNRELFANDTNTIYFNCIIVLFFTHLGNHLMLFWLTFYAL